MVQCVGCMVQCVGYGAVCGGTWCSGAVCTGKVNDCSAQVVRYALISSPDKLNTKNVTCTKLFILEENLCEIFCYQLLHVVLVSGDHRILH